MAAATVIARLLAVGHLLFTQRLQTLFRAVATVGGAHFQHVVNNCIVAVETFGLEIRTFIPLQIQPVHAIHNGFDSLWRRAFEIGVFNTQHKLTVLVTCEKPGIESGTRPTDVQIAGRAWREASFDFHEMALR